MASRQSAMGALVGLSLMFALAAVITIVVFLTLIAPDERGNAFYVWMAAACTAEFVFFAWSCNGVINRRAPRRLSGATHIMVHVLIVIWLVVTIAAAVMVTPPGQVQSYYADRIAMIYAILTFLFFFGAYSLYAKDLTIQQEDRLTQADRLDLRKRVGDLDTAVQALRGAASKHPGQAVAIDRLIKRLEAVRTGLDYAPPGKVGTVEEEGGKHVDVVNARINEQVDQLMERLGALSQGTVEREIEAIQSLLDRVDALLRERQHQLI